MCFLFLLRRLSCEVLQLKFQRREFNIFERTVPTIHGQLQFVRILFSGSKDLAHKHLRGRLSAKKRPSRCTQCREAKRLSGEIGMAEK